MKTSGMKTIGMIGGTTWLSTVDYYRYVNQMVNDRVGGFASANILLRSLNMEEIKALADGGKWEEITDIYSSCALKLQDAGAECLVLCANTPHVVGDAIQKNIGIPLINIADETAKQIRDKKLGSVGLLGTRFTMEHTFYPDRLSRFCIETLTPPPEDRTFIHNSIFDELGKGIFLPETKNKFLAIIAGLQQRGAAGIIFGCTEIPLILSAADCSVPTFDTTMIHSRAAVDFALGAA